MLDKILHVLHTNKIKMSCKKPNFVVKCKVRVASDESCSLLEKQWGEKMTLQFASLLEIEDKGDIDLAVLGFSELAEYGDIDAIQKMAMLCLNKKHPYYNPKNAIKWLMQGISENEDLFCKQMLAYCYMGGIGIRQNKEAAIARYLEVLQEDPEDCDVALIVACYYLEQGKNVEYIARISKLIEQDNVEAIIFHSMVIDKWEEFDSRVEEEKQKIREKLERKAQLEKYNKIKKRLRCSLSEIHSIFYEKKIDNKTHWWRANKI